MRALDSKTLRGLWAAVPTPWTRDGTLDEGVLGRNCQRLAGAKVDGIYTTDSDGEFYAVEIAEFRKLAKAFGKAMESTGVNAAMGVTWCNTQGITDRIRTALDAGIPNVHIGLPFFMPLAKPDVDQFFDDLAQTAPEARWIHYAHPTITPTLTGADYARLSERFPEQFIGTKLAASSIAELTEILVRSPGLAHFVVDTTMAHGMLMGAKGCYSYWVNTMPRWHRAYMDACVDRRWDDAIGYHLKLVGWEAESFPRIRELRHRHAITGNARVTLTRFLEDSSVTKPPYYPLAPELLLELQASFKRSWAQEIADERFAEHSP